MTPRLLRLALAAALAASAAAALAQRALDPHDPVAVAAWIRTRGFECPAVHTVELEGQTNRGNLYRVGCYFEDSAVARWYQMILSPDESHASLYPCVDERVCPFSLR
ncbi:MAG: hypothetical protein ACREH3_08940 [Geminicoccales bacterium]